jgi:hypothetical protein
LGEAIPEAAPPGAGVLGAPAAVVPPDAAEEFKELFAAPAAGLAAVLAVTVLAVTVLVAPPFALAAAELTLLEAEFAAAFSTELVAVRSAAELAGSPAVTSPDSGIAFRPRRNHRPPPTTTAVPAAMAIRAGVEFVPFKRTINYSFLTLHFELSATTLTRWASYSHNFRQVH